MSSDNETPDICISSTRIHSLEARADLSFALSRLLGLWFLMEEEKRGLLGFGHDRDDMYDQIEGGQPLPDDQLPSRDLFLPLPQAFNDKDRCNASVVATGSRAIP